jgi:DivIVA domain-containing protein
VPPGEAWHDRGVELFVLLGALGVIGVVAAVAAGRVRGGLDEPTTSRPYLGLPEQSMAASDVDAVRFSLAWRGYRMDEVDEVLGRLRKELAGRDVEIARLRAAFADDTPFADDAPFADDTTSR